MKTIDLSRRGGVVTDTQPEIFPLPTGLLPKDDLTNRKIDRVTVLGWSGVKASSAGVLWVVRCDCGSYTFKRSHALKLGLLINANIMCANCRQAAHLEKGFTSPNCPPELRDKYYHDGADSWRNRPDSDE